MGNEAVMAPFVKNKQKRIANTASAMVTAITMIAKYPYVFFASNFSVNVNMDSLSSKFGDANAIMGMVVGLAIWICQMVGVGMFIWGIYGYVTARKDGEAEAMNGALGKLIAGAVLIGMKGILNMMGIVNN